MTFKKIVVVVAVFFLPVSFAAAYQQNPQPKEPAITQAVDLPAPKEVPSELPPATTGDVLALTRQVLETSQSHSQRSHDYLRNIFYALGFIAAGLGFFGFREIKSVLKPYKDKLEAMTLAHDEKIKAISEAHDAALKKQAEEVNVLKREHEEAMAEQLASIEALKGEHELAMTEQLDSITKLRDEHEQAMTTQIEEFVNLSQLNAKALVVASTIWQYIGVDNPDEDQLREAVRLADSSIPAEDIHKLDAFLAGVLLIRKAYAQKRLGDFEGAFESASRAVNINGDGSKNFWVSNTACYAALAGRPDECFMYLERALRTDPASRDRVQKDPDLDRVRDDPRFNNIFA